MNKLTWNNITLTEYLEILDIKKDDSIDILDKIIYYNQIFGIRDTDDEYWDNLLISNIKNEMYIVKFINNKVNSEKLGDLWNTNKITLGEFIDLYESYKINDWKVFLNVLNISINDITIQRFLYYKESFEKYYEKLKNSYKVLYPEGKETNENDLLDYEEIIKKEKNAKVKKELKAELTKDKNKKTYHWLNLVYFLCDGDITKYKEVIGMSNILAHSWLALRIMKNNGQI